MYEAYQSDLPQLKEIWKKIFKDTDDYISLYFGEKFLPEKTYVSRDNGIITSTLYFSDVNLYHLSKVYKAAYICGIATLPEYRKEGQASGLIRKCLDDLKNRDYDFAFLIPATASLFGFYEKFGFEGFSSLEISECEISPAFEEYVPFPDTDIGKIYDSNFDGLKIMRTKKDFELLDKCYGKPYVFGDGYIYAYKTDSCLNIIEHSYKSRDELIKKARIIADEGTDRLIIKSADASRIGRSEPFSVYINFKGVSLPERRYINLLLN